MVNNENDDDDQTFMKNIMLVCFLYKDLIEF